MHSSKLKCDQCGAPMRVERCETGMIAKCPYCDYSKLLAADNLYDKHKEAQRPRESSFRPRRVFTFCSVLVIGAAIILALIFFKRDLGEKDDVVSSAGVVVEETIAPEEPSAQEKRVRTPFSAHQLTGKNITEVVEIMDNAGFVSIQTYGLNDLKDTLFRSRKKEEGIVTRITINGDDSFERYIYYSNHSKICIWFHSYP